MSKNAKEFALASFSSDTFADKVLKIYENAIALNNPKKRGIIKYIYHAFFDRMPLV